LETHVPHGGNRRVAFAVNLRQIVGYNITHIESPFAL
jgi:hypothetical protein